MATLTLQQFINQNVGGFARQCVALVEEWRQALGQPIIATPTGVASDFLHAPGFHPGTGGLRPGDILVFKPGVGGVGSIGHVALNVKRVGSGLEVFGANWGVGHNENQGLPPSLANVPLSDIAGYIPEKAKAAVNFLKTGKTEQFRLSNGTTVQVKGYTQSELNSLHERLELLLSAGGTIDRLKENPNGSITIFGHQDRFKATPLGGIVGGLFDAFSINHKAQYQATWSPSGKVKLGAHSSPTFNPAAAAVSGLGQDFVSAFTGAIKAPFEGKHLWKTLLVIAAVLVLIGVAVSLAKQESPTPVPVPV